ncbi:MAG: hypothetical protein IJ838_03715 [Paludibacteraceae bacterium]|nr:hypothetical protein [Paludibacteraceae bacterium]
MIRYGKKFRQIRSLPIGTKTMFFEIGQSWCYADHRTESQAR